MKLNIICIINFTTNKKKLKNLKFWRLKIFTVFINLKTRFFLKTWKARFSNQFCSPGKTSIPMGHPWKWPHGNGRDREYWKPVPHISSTHTIRYDTIRYDIRLLKRLSECRAHTIKLQVKNN